MKIRSMFGAFILVSGRFLGINLVAPECPKQATIIILSTLALAVGASMFRKLIYSSIPEKGMRHA
jgi:hypothetical protein